MSVNKHSIDDWQINTGKSFFIKTSIINIVLLHDFLFIVVKEEKFLHQIRLEEQFGPIVSKTVEEEKKALAPKKAAIAFSYTEEAADEDEDKPGSSNTDSALPEGGEEAAGEGTDDESDSDVDLGEWC